MNKVLCDNTLSLLLSVYLAAVLVIPCLNFWGTTELFPTVWTIFFLLCNEEILQFLDIHVHTLLFTFWFQPSWCVWKSLLLCFLVWIYVVTIVFEHLFISLLIIYRSSLENCLFNSFGHFKIGLLRIWQHCWRKVDNGGGTGAGTFYV